LETDSVSRFKLVLEIRGKAKLECDFKKHLSPRTVGSIVRSLPLEGNAHHLGSTITYMETPIDSGVDRPRKEFKKCDIAFLPANGSICFFSADTTTAKPMTPLGKITSNVDELRNVKSGDVLKLYRI